MVGSGAPNGHDRKKDILTVGIWGVPLNKIYTGGNVVVPICLHYDKKLFSAS